MNLYKSFFPICYSNGNINNKISASDHKVALHEEVLFQEIPAPFHRRTQGPNLSLTASKSGNSRNLKLSRAFLCFLSFYYQFFRRLLVFSARSLILIMISPHSHLVVHLDHAIPSGPP
jgi:hypothetical protein